LKHWSRTYSGFGALAKLVRFTAPMELSIEGYLTALMKEEIFTKTVPSASIESPEQQEVTRNKLNDFKADLMATVTRFAYEFTVGGIFVKFIQPTQSLPLDLEWI
jgi:hypothetical protein